jgi:hypothetical protein
LFLQAFCVNVNKLSLLTALRNNEAWKLKPPANQFNSVFKEEKMGDKSPKNKEKKKKKQIKPTSTPGTSNTSSIAKK